MYRNSDTAPWKLDVDTFKRHEDAEKTANDKYIGKFTEVKVGMVLLEDGRRSL